MHLESFLNNCRTTPDLSGVSTVTFQSKTYPPLFFSLLFQALKKTTSCVLLDASTVKFQELIAQLETSFLGKRMVYWVKTNDLNLATREKWAAFLKDYQGTHVILSHSTTVTSTSIPLPNMVEQRLYQLLSSFFSIPLDKQFLTELYWHQSLSLDAACQMMLYQAVVGKNTASFFKQWYTKLISSQKSLFTLSQYFFARQPQAFLQQWKACIVDFPDEFWVAYWSEQLFQATLFVHRARTKDYSVAKEAAKKLPFSFINKDWQHYTQAQLTQAHQELYQVDYDLKHSATQGLELFYHRFLNY